MSRLYDRIVRSGEKCATDTELSQAWWRNRGWGPGGIDVVGEASVVQVGNAADYWLRYKPGAKSLSCLAPPFPVAFYEYRRPNFIPKTHGFAECGFFATAWDLRDKRQRAEWLSFSDPNKWNVEYEDDSQRPELDSPINQEINEKVRWVVEYALFADESSAGGLGGPSINLTTFLNGQGQEVGFKTGGKGAWFTPMLPDIDSEKAKIYYEFALSVLGPIYFAISLMHCKNVAVEENEPPQKLSRRHLKKYGIPLSRYYTLAIEPMSGAESKMQSSRLDERSNDRSWHICRGHFATYSPEKPLFGKYPGTFWKPQHVKGSKASGEVIKDYAVKAPQS